MAAKMNGTFELDDNMFEFSAIAFGRIGGQNIGVEKSEEMKNKLTFIVNQYLPKEVSLTLPKLKKSNTETNKKIELPKLKKLTSADGAIV